MMAKSAIDVAMLSRAILLVSFLAFGCGEPAATAPADLPERLTGAFGQNETHATMNTAGLELSGTTLRYGELTLTITAGAATGADDYRVDKAEAAWTKDTKGPKPCTGTISRQGNVLLVKLFKEGTDTRCESVLDGEWKAWTVSDTIPENLRGVYGGDARTESADVGVKLEDKTIGFTDGGDAVTIEQVVAWVDKPGTAYVRKSKFLEFGCTGSMELVDERLTLTLKPTEGAPAGASCPNGQGRKWTVDAKHLPKSALDNGKVTIAVDGEHLVLTDREGAKCRQKILQTAARSTSGSAYDGIPVTGGAVLVLEHGVPESTTPCKTKLENLAATLCAEGGFRCTEAQAAIEMPIVCPRQVVIGDPIKGGIPAAMLPASFTNLACWNMSGGFAAK